ncbi:hypothetical protein ILUMI_12916 [Ignelater luminosus]|uniref:THAP-type domain-containing protein n=1 Tax=Ignelater luminosus TaxID=2038154 RepID=A0A8K0D1V4_IGNLU|nr:hypothetical protein ILUMI_12916 [Ignelater luminosus]
MTGCTAANCTNHSRQGFRLFIFPRDPKRRAIWIQNCNRENWVPPKNARLCERHFDPSQFESRRADGKHKLKPNAIPTLFDLKDHRLQTSTANKINLINIATPSSFVNSSEEINSTNIATVPFVNLSKEFNSTNIATPASFVNSPEEYDLCNEDFVLIKSEYEDTNNQVQNLKRRLWRAAKQIQDLRKKNQQLTDIIAQNPFLDEEHKKILVQGNKHILWTPNTIRKAVKLRFTIGSKGYQYLQKSMGRFLPSHSTLCRHLHKITFNPGLLEDLIPFLAEKRNGMKSNSESECILLIGEMEIEESLDFDASLDSYVGYSSMKQDKILRKLGNRLFICILRGLNSNWKQVIAYHIINKTGSNDEIFHLIKNVIIKVEDIGYKVLGLVSDMTLKNQILWRNLKIHIDKHSENNVVAHPAREQETLYVFADTLHLLENFRSALMKNDFIVPNSVMKKEQLPSDIISFKYLVQLVEIQTKNNLQLITNNITEHALHPTPLKNMCAVYAAYIFSNTTASAIETLVSLELMDKDALTTAWFLRQIRMWFDILNSRNRKTAISKNNKSEYFDILNEFLHLIRNIKIGDDGSWKPVQTGIILTTLNMIALSEELLTKRKCKYVLTSRINQDVLENLLSALKKYGNNNQTALQVTRILKPITISQFWDNTSDLGVTCIDNNYDKHYINLLAASSKQKTTDVQVQNISEESCIPNTSLMLPEDFHNERELIEKNTINNLLAVAIFKSCKSLCKTCRKALTTNPKGKERRILINSKTFGKIYYPANEMLNLTSKIDRFITRHIQLCKNHPKLAKHLFFLIKRRYNQILLPTCKICQSYDVMITSYINLKLSIASSKNTKC